MATDLQESNIEGIVKTLQFGQEDKEDPDETYSDNKNPVNREIKEWYTQPMEIAEFNEVCCENTYIKGQINKSNLVLNNPIECAEAGDCRFTLSAFQSTTTPQNVRLSIRNVEKFTTGCKNTSLYIPRPLNLASTKRMSKCQCLLRQRREIVENR